MAFRNDGEIAVRFEQGQLVEIPTYLSGAGAFATAVGEDGAGPDDILTAVPSPLSKSALAPLGVPAATAMDAVRTSAKVDKNAIPLIQFLFIEHTSFPLDNF